jgi:hypothetical protein
MSGKGSRQRPGNGYSEGFDILWPKNICGKCNKPVANCGCCPTEDGPGRDEDVKENEIE